MLGFGLFGRIWVRIGPKGDKALRMGQGGRMDGRTYVRTDGRTDSPCVLQDFVPFGDAAQKKRKKKKDERREMRRERSKVINYNYDSYHC